jgi:hypothetical protein
MCSSTIGRQRSASGHDELEVNKKKEIAAGERDSDAEDAEIVRARKSEKKS